MPPLPSLPARVVLKALEKAGYRIDRVTGSHHVMVHTDRPPVSVPVHKGRDMKKGTLRGIIKDTGLIEAEFLELI
ncbi:type II toxin-antitoxin system HicA family toxin [Nocardiopsis sp. CC223A]|uniref:type II toxin-antitoxin system HicA family toxin n=1 Tax=Nocardiopsis sp. CC223A TaxID=3044051 RepID=UPI002795B2DE|nr:type II toxin-antitoxin system HicA family toxin [Nocardiopsis sp. CC223A]